MYWLSIYLLFSSALGSIAASIQNRVMDSCAAVALPFPDLFGAEFTSLSAFSVMNYSVDLRQMDNHAPVNITGLNFCNVSIQYTHPGQNDDIHVEVWLPFESWNGRFMGTGGGAYATGLGALSLAYAVSLGYSAASSDGGHILNYEDPSSWALSSPGNVNWVLLQDFAAVALDDLTTIGKAITTAYYGSPPSYSYWNGCSTGGRQGLMMAQRYPSQYDGILATAPGIYWDSFLVTGVWAQLVMNELGIYPPQCEFEAITAAATMACDDLDGVIDGIIAAPGLCSFDPHTVVGQVFYCADSGTNRTISSEAAAIALAAWMGPRSVDGRFQWYGLTQDTSLSNTTCRPTEDCDGLPFLLASNWIKFFVQEDPNFDVANMSHRQYDTIFRQSTNRFSSILGTSDPDLTDFREAGGKMITWHGLADEVIPVNGTYEYYQRVLDFDPNAADYFRFFPAPGVAHCLGGKGWYPDAALQSLVDWVENDIVPETLLGTTLPDANGTTRQAPLCPYPLVAAFKGGDIDEASSFHCQPSF